MSMKVRIDRDRCVGHGRCYGLAPDVFEPDDEGYALVLEETPSPKQEGDVQRAYRNCPERAVVVEQEVSA